MQPSVSSKVQNQQKDGPLCIETTVLNAPSSGDEGPANDADTQHVDSARNSERQTSEPSEDVPSRRETFNLSAFSSVGKGSVNNADTRYVDSVGNSERQKSKPAATPENRIMVAPQTPQSKGKNCKSERRKKPRQESPNKGAKRKSEQTGGDDCRKRRCSNTSRREQSRSKRKRQEETNQYVPLGAGTGVKSAQKLQELVMSFKGLKFCQVKTLKGDNALKVYRELQNGELNWTTVMEDKGPNSILTVCK